MVQFTIARAAAVAVAANALALAGAAAAVTITGSGSMAGAADTVRALQDRGYTVRLHRTSTVPLTRCAVTGMRGPANSGTDAAEPPIDAGPSSTVFVDVSCPTS